MEVSMISYMDLIADSYRNSKDMKTRMMFAFYEQNLKPRINSIIKNEFYGDGIYYEAWIDLTDYFIPDNYEMLRQIDFDQAAELCVKYMIEQEQKY